MPIKGTRAEIIALRVSRYGRHWHKVDTKSIGGHGNALKIVPPFYQFILDIFRKFLSS